MMFSILISKILLSLRQRVVKIIPLEEIRLRLIPSFLLKNSLTLLRKSRKSMKKQFPKKNSKKWKDYHLYMALMKKPLPVWWLQIMMSIKKKVTDLILIKSIKSSCKKLTTHLLLKRIREVETAKLIVILN